MKAKFLPFSMLLAGMFAMTSCHSDVENEVAEPCVPVTFNLNPIGLDGLYPIADETRAITTAPVRLLVLDVVDGNVVSENTVDQEVSTPLDKLTMTLSYGTHTLYFLLSAKPYDSYDASKLTVTWGSSNRLSYVWALKKDIQVTGEAIEEQSLSLDLVIGQIRMICNDAFPANIGNVEISSPGLCWTLNLSTMQGVPGSVTYNLDASTMAGQKGKNFTSYTFVPADGKISEITYKAYTNNEDSPELIKQHTISNLQVQKGYTTQYSGNFFSSDASFALTYQNDWAGTITGTY